MSTENNKTHTGVGYSMTDRREGYTATALERKQWHGPYFCSMRLELIHNRDGCVYDGEYLLNTQPLQIDMLARTEGETVWWMDEITAGFRKHNIIEFKSPDDDLNLDVFYKNIGYGCLYKAQESRVDEILRTEISLTFIRERKPEKLLHELEKTYGIVQSAPGIYKVMTEPALFPVQILVLREMDWHQHIWVTALKKEIAEEHARTLILEMKKFHFPDEREWADSVLQLAMANNKKIFETLKGDEFMCQALRELMADEIDEELEKAEAFGRQEGNKEGAARLFNIIKRLRDGESAETICISGMDEETVKMAQAALRL